MSLCLIACYRGLHNPRRVILLPRIPPPRQAFDSRCHSCPASRQVGISEANAANRGLPVSSMYSNTVIHPVTMIDDSPSRPRKALSRAASTGAFDGSVGGGTTLRVRVARPHSAGLVFDVPADRAAIPPQRRQPNAHPALLTDHDLCLCRVLLGATHIASPKSTPFRGLDASNDAGPRRGATPCRKPDLANILTNGGSVSCATSLLRR